MQVLFY